MEEPTQPENWTKPKHSSEFFLMQLERGGTPANVLRFWFTRAWKIGLLMAKGGYLLSERKKLFKRLGEETYYRIQKGDLSLTELIPLTEEIKALTKKIELEELLIRRVRFGTAFRRRSLTQSTTENNEPTTTT